MEHKSGVIKSDEHLELPPGFRFHPTDEELITYYLSNKVLDSNFSAIAIGEVDMNKVEPWDLPWRANLGEKAWYFFCVRDRKYPTGLRTNRATAAGYWKATGKDKEIYRGKALVGMKKTLVFYKGRAPKGEKSNWVAHEYRLEEDFPNEKLSKSAKNDWVISRVFQKTSGGKKVHISELVGMDSDGNGLNPSTKPPLIESSNPKSEPGHVHCFSRPITAPVKIQEDLLTCFNDPILPSTSNPVDIFSIDSFSSFPGLTPFQESIVSRTFPGNDEQNFSKEKETVSVSHEHGSSSGVSKSFEENGVPSTSFGIHDFDCIWSY